nr:MAG TPA: hypothetical protein [Caudoviricetes sp.]DAV72950.1 MAG TPA: hypothetical protein [Caudoviricetes sp.]
MRQTGRERFLHLKNKTRPSKNSKTWPMVTGH